jgi:hypothetical protein
MRRYQDDRFMWNVDSPFEKHSRTDGGIEILAKGRSAMQTAIDVGGCDRSACYGSPHDHGSPTAVTP